MKEVLRLKNIVKTFPGVLALVDINFDLKAGEVHAICGENGAGKSTMVKIITGAVSYTHLLRFALENLGRGARAGFCLSRTLRERK